jgi:hypothetical protein
MLVVMLGALYIAAGEAESFGCIGADRAWFPQTKRWHRAKTLV